MLEEQSKRNTEGRSKVLLQRTPERALGSQLRLRGSRLGRWERSGPPLPEPAAPECAHKHKHKDQT
jgi:hypothetical protein